MLVLGIETSGFPGSIALRQGGALLEERELPQQSRKHAQSLVSAIGELFGDHSFSPADCELVAVSLGPGSFTGLRVGVVCAKTFAYGVDCPAIGVDSFLAVAAAAPADVHSLHVVSNAQRKQLFWGRFQRSSNGYWQQEGEIAIVDAAAWCADRTAEDLLTGPELQSLAERFPLAGRQLPPDCHLPRAALIAELGQLMGEGKITPTSPSDLWTLEPKYLRKSAAEEKWDLERAKCDTQSD